MAYNKKGYYRRAQVIQEITRKYYEPERQDRCYAAVWRKYIHPSFGICYASYLRYLKVILPENKPLFTNKQLSIFEEIK